MKQNNVMSTALQELIQFILDNRGSQKDILDEAKSLLAKEKGQIIDAWLAGLGNDEQYSQNDAAYEYYNETYKQK